MARGADPGSTGSRVPVLLLALTVFAAFERFGPHAL
jgi:hypothetical protein